MKINNSREKFTASPESGKNRENKKTPRQMWVNLSKLFHPDREGGGKPELMKEVNLAYEKFEKAGDPADLITLYNKYGGRVSRGKENDANFNKRNLGKYEKSQEVKGGGMDMYV